MNEKLESIKANISASLGRTKAFYSSHRTLLLSGITVLSILLIVWARMGFTVQIGQFFAAEPGQGDTCAVSRFCAGNNLMRRTALCEGILVETCPSGCESTGATTAQCKTAATVTTPTCAATRPLVANAPESICARPAAFDAFYNNTCPNPTRGSNGEYYYLSQKTREDGSSFGVPLGCVEHPDNCPEGMLAWSSNYCLPVSDPRVGGATPTPTVASTPPPAGRPAAAVLTVACTGTQAVLTWNIPAGIVENVVQKNVNNAGWQIAFSDSTKSVKTFTETFVATTVYRHKTDPNVVSNSVQCPGAAGTATPTPAGNTPSVLTAVCGATQNVLSWNLPAGHDSNSLQRKIGAGGNWSFIGTGFTNTAPVTYTDTAVQAEQIYVYRHKAWANTPSNEVICPSSTPTPTATVTPSPSLSPTPTMTPTLALAIGGRNVTTGGVQSSSVQAQGGQQVEITMLVRNSQATLNNVVVRAPLPTGLTYVAGSTTIAGTPTAVESITTGGLSLGTMAPQQQTAVVFRARVVGASFAVGTTQVEITVVASADGVAQQSGTLFVVVTRAAVAPPGTVQTGPGDAVFAALLVSAIMTLLYVSYTHTSAYKRKEIEAITQNRDPMDFRS